MRKFSLWAHQKEGVQRGIQKRDFAYFCEMGTGKTLMTIMVLRHWYNAHKAIIPTLIFAPPIAVPNWKDEILAFSKIKSKDIFCLQGSGKKRLEIVQKNMDRGCIFITNYEALLMEDLFKAFKKWGPLIQVFDESHKLKDMKSKRTKKAIELAELAEHRYILTGTPVLKDPMDLFSQYRVLDLGETFGRNFFAFRGKYFWDKNAGMPKHNYFPDWRIRTSAMKDINAKLKETGIAVKKEECMDLPPFVRKKITVELSTEQKKHYKMMQEHLVTYLEDEACVAELALTKALRLQQIVSGFLAVEQDAGKRKNIKFQKNPRIEALSQLLDDLPAEEKVIIWAVFKQNYKDLRELFEKKKWKFVEIHGEITDKQKQENKDAFNNDPSVKICLGHPGSGGIGINLVSAAYSVFFSRSFSLEQDQQAEARNYRGGSEIHEKITRFDLVAKDTIDELVLERLAQKKNVGAESIRQMLIQRKAA